ncbi:MAG: hypothetical protein RLZZ216_1013 [Cyanobacteriota bacterium]|jgi:predicted kinase
MTEAPLRCHLLIGAPGSGKTTMAHKLAPLLAAEDGTAALVLSTDAIRAELFGDAAVQGPWDEVRALMLQRLQAAISANRTVIIDATHARRPWRLLYTQALRFTRPVEWIGWWFTTPLDTCLEWAQTRERPVPVSVIRDFHAAITHKQFGPHRAEGFASVVKLNPAAGESQPEALATRLRGLDGAIRNALNRDQAKTPFLHRYSRLLDLERLLFLLRLLTQFNGLDQRDQANGLAMEQICNPLPSGDVAELAAALLSRWDQVHGGNSEVYGDVEAIRADLVWLEANGFTRLDWSSNAAIELGPEGPVQDSSCHGGVPALADRRAFIRVFTLLRHVLKEPFDAPADAVKSSEGGSLYQHLIDRLSDIEGSYGPDPSQQSVLRKDLQGLLRPYGFSPEIKGRPDSLRSGYAIGTALLSADQLLEIHGLLSASMERLSDASTKPLLTTLELRLRRAGLLEGAMQARREPKRALAHRSTTEARPGTLAGSEQGQRLERAIHQRRCVWLRHEPDQPSEEQRRRGDDGRFRAWPLQLLFHNISWYLAFETVSVGHPQGLIRMLRLDRLVLLGEDGNLRRSQEQDHRAAMERMKRLLHVCGGLYFGDDIQAQLALMEPRDGLMAGGLEVYERLRFSCTAKVFRLIREEPHRFPLEHTSYSKPLPGEKGWEPGPLDRLTPNAATDSHPYPVELFLPRWTVREDWDLRNWLFRWGGAVRIESPLELRDLHQQMARDVVGVYANGFQSSGEGPAAR